MAGNRKRDASRQGEEMERLPYFVPDELIDVEPLAAYTRQLMDSGIELKIGKNPHKPTQNGYYVNSAVAITMTDIKAIQEDTALYKRERELGTTKSYTASKAWQRREQIGRAQQNVRGNAAIPTYKTPMEKVTAGNMASAARPGVNNPQSWQDRDQLYGQRGSPAQGNVQSYGENFQRDMSKSATPYQTRETQFSGTYTEYSPRSGGQEYQDESMSETPWNTAPPQYESKPGSGGSQPPISSSPGLNLNPTAGPWSGSGNTGSGGGGGGRRHDRGQYR